MLLTATLLNQSLAFAWTEMRRARPRHCEDRIIGARDKLRVLDKLVGAYTADAR